jgi:hypothetical protein
MAELIYEVISRKEAKEKGQNYYFTGIICKNGHIDLRQVNDFKCKSCGLERRKADYKKNAENEKAYAKQYYHNNKERLNYLSRKYSKNNRNKINELSKQFRSQRPEVGLSNVNKRRAAKIKATPKWFENEKENIRELYRQAKILEEETGDKYHVDHIVPLIHDGVCGLHCLENLRVIPAKENLAKNNYFVID